MKTPGSRRIRSALAPARFSNTTSSARSSRCIRPELISSGRLHRLERAGDVVFEERAGATAERIRRDPAVFTDLFVR